MVEALSGVKQAWQRVKGRLRSSPLGQRWRQYGPLLCVVGPALWVVSPLWKETPLSYDHATHLFKAWHFWTEMLGRGRLRGWSHFWAFGFPSDELVPFGEELWVCLFRVLTFGQLPWTRTYALAFAALLVFKVLTAFWFTRRYFSTTAAVACAWFVLFDPGAMLEGGWHWHTYFGVWPVELAMCFVLLTYLRLERVFEERSARSVLWAGLCFGASLLSHQLALLMFVATAPLFFLEHFLRPRRAARQTAAGASPAPAAPELHGFALATGALGLGFALAAFSVVPFIARSGNAQDLGWLGDSLEQMSQKLLQLRTFENVWYPIHGLALLGAWFALRTRRPGAVFIAASGALFVFLSSSTLVADWHLDRALSTLLKIETNRMLVSAKLFWFALAGHGLAELLRLPIVPASLLPRGRRIFGGVVALAFCVALFLPGWSQFYEAQIKKDFVGEKEIPFYKDLQAVFAWSKTLERKPGEFYRIAYHFAYGTHLTTIAPVYDHAPMYKVGYTPTQIFDKVPTTDEPELFQALSIKYVVSPYPLERADLGFERRFGQLWLYHSNTYDPHPFHLNGPGQAELLEFEPERVRVRLSGTSADSRFVLHVANYDRWQATLAGAVVPIASVPVYGVEYPLLMEVPARDGELVFEYVYRGGEWLGLILSLAALPVFVGLVWLGRHSTWPLRMLAGLARARRPIGWATLALLLAIGVVLAQRTRDRRRMLPQDSLFHQLSGPELTLDGEPCQKTHPLTFRCGDHVLRPEVVPGIWGIHSCMSTTVNTDLRLVATLPLGSFIAGRYDPRKDGEGLIQVSVNGQSLGRVETRDPRLRAQAIEFDTRAQTGAQADLDISVEGAALYCFDFRILP